MRILSIETSCDETAIALVDAKDDGSFAVLANETLSQAELHSEYGGVFPTLAKREHAKTLVPLLLRVIKASGVGKTRGAVPSSEKAAAIKEALSREGALHEVFESLVSELGNPRIDRIVVTQGPGLEPALWVGINFARALGILWDVPVVPANHMEGHVLAAMFDEKTGKIADAGFPLVALLISGGHTELVRVEAPGSYALLGETKDDAVGECFDKVARLLGLPYPGGPEISRLAGSGTPGRYALPRPMIGTKDCDFSFSGLKTAVLYLVKKLAPLSEEMKADIAREFEEAVTEVLVKKTRRAVEESEAKGIVVGGGVSANARIRAAIGSLAREKGIPAYLPSRTLSTDNALMIALAGKEKTAPQAPAKDLSAKGNWKVYS